MRLISRFGRLANLYFWPGTLLCAAIVFAASYVSDYAETGSWGRLALWWAAFFATSLSGALFVSRTSMRLQKMSVSPKPSALAEFLVTLVFPGNDADGLLGDLNENLNNDLARMPVRRAKARYWGRVLRSIGPLLYAKARKIGVFALVAYAWKKL